MFSCLDRLRGGVGYLSPRARIAAALGASVPSHTAGAMPQRRQRAVEANLVNYAARNMKGASGSRARSAGLAFRD